MLPLCTWRIAAIMVLLLASKTRVSSLKGQTILRLELLRQSFYQDSFLVLVNLMSFVGEIVCLTESLIVMHWIKGIDRHWKTFVQNRVQKNKK